MKKTFQVNFFVALGGTAPGSDEIIFEENITSFEFQNQDADLLNLQPRPGFQDFTSGQGAQVIPQKVGIGYVMPVINGQPRDPIEITIAPQSLIQILLGEARGELTREATLDNQTKVKSSSVSVTGDAVGAVIRNRINLINEHGETALFVVDSSKYAIDPPLSYYDAVIEAKGTSAYQFSPVDPEDPSHDVYQKAQNRAGLDGSLDMAYDQAVLTAAAIFNSDTRDPTGGAFAYYSPSAPEAQILKKALEDQVQDLPQNAGTSDENFPAFAPVQVLMLQEIAASAKNAEVPSFVFVRSKNIFDPAVTDQP